MCLKERNPIGGRATNWSSMRWSTHFLFVVEEVKRFLVADLLEELNKKLDRYYMDLIKPTFGFWSCSFYRLFDY